MSKTAYVAFGSNIGSCAENIDEAVRAFTLVPGVKVENVSPYFITRPCGCAGQNNFVNACARLLCDISPEALLGVCLGIEGAMGRVRNVKNGPRLIDIDLIIYENEKRNSDELTLPHPRFSERDFVLLPLIEAARAEDKKYFSYLLEKIPLSDRYTEKRL